MFISVVSIDAAVKQRTDYVEVNAKFSNAGLSAGFYWREVGIFCADPDNPNDRSKDILYCYQNAYDTADYIAPQQRSWWKERHYPHLSWATPPT